jgi:diguanylate cyclase (GGDEF)-like protein
MIKRDTIKMTAAVGFTLGVLTLYSIWSYFYEKNRLIAQIDKQLYSAAVAVPFVLETDFHDRAVTSGSIILDEDNQNITNLSKLNDQLGTKFLYTIIRDTKGIYRLSSSSALADEIKKQKEVHYFTEYPDVSDILKKSFENLSINFIKPNKIYNPVYVPVFSDRWGTYRSIFLPIRSLNGRLYVVGVDMDISYVNDLLRDNTIQTILSFLLFLVAIFPMVLSYISMLKRKHKEYQAIHKLYIDHSKRSVTDALTQLYNRYKLDNELNLHYKHFQEMGESFSLLLLDLDHFKNINDEYGHHEGDDTLKVVAQTLKESCRTTDIIGRWGGEEFMIICPNSDLDSGFILAEKLRLAIKNSPQLEKYKLTVSIGIGVSKQYITLKQFVRNVDEALYQAKKKGRNQSIKVNEL